MVCAVEMASGVMIYIPSLKNIGRGIQEILRCCLINFRRCNFGTADVRDLRITPLRWPLVALYTTYQVS
jgi:hypothetical protein